jgi:two-component SAPR family response regulator
VQANNQVITSSMWQTQAARDLFFMLLAHPEGMTKEEISLIFWPDASTEEIKFRFKNTVYRLRRALGKESVILEQDIYRFNNCLDYEYDVEIFLKEYALASKAKDPLQKLSHFREAVKYYRGNYLPDVVETWALTPRENLKQNFVSVLLQVSEIYLNQSNYDLALEYCQRALTEDNLLEDAYRLALRIFAAQGNRAALVRQYQRCVEVLEREISAEPSPQTQALYNELIR